jgi:hypothetical protein
MGGALRERSKVGAMPRRLQSSRVQGDTCVVRRLAFVVGWVHRRRPLSVVKRLRGNECREIGGGQACSDETVYLCVVINFMFLSYDRNALKE